MSRDLLRQNVVQANTVASLRLVTLGAKFCGVTLYQWCRSLLSIEGDYLQFYPNFVLFSTLGGMNLDHDFIRVWRFSEDQKKKQQMEHFFS